jgi:hypothetical protein
MYFARTPERISEATSVGVRGLSREDLSSKDNAFYSAIAKRASLTPLMAKEYDLLFSRRFLFW